MHNSMIEQPGPTNIEISKHSQSKEIIIRFLRNKAAVLGLIIIVILLFCMLFPSALTSYNPNKQMLTEKFIAPNAEHLF